MAFDGNEGSPITEARATELTKNYREANPGQVQSYFFGRKIIETLLAQGGMGIRIYYGLDNGVPQLLAVGAEANENDQLGDGFIIADEASCGPPHSGQANFLNS
ncbi:hypothetical protein [Hymenobacter armeniacus]|uniref:Uncharacterized protein n=1 Tax=Hymenobacter armeniacus TaxID=2771358 RepID=A0ABR8JVC9_9BACT|nr:hypothetical protein [Hymenobacter armeniacus]MBD2721919.1 hypothetical protein [Hymenobacter armeniacus]